MTAAVRPATLVRWWTIIFSSGKLETRPKRRVPSNCSVLSQDLQKACPFGRVLCPSWTEIFTMINLVVLITVFDGIVEFLTAELRRISQWNQLLRTEGPCHSIMAPIALLRSHYNLTSEVRNAYDTTDTLSRLRLSWHNRNCFPARIW